VQRAIDERGKKNQRKKPKSISKEEERQKTHLRSLLLSELTLSLFNLLAQRGLGLGRSFLLGRILRHLFGFLTRENTKKARTQF
jgi:hypothetical protein